MMRFIIYFLLIVSVINGQKLKGIVYENTGGEKIPLPGVNIYWKGTSLGTTTNKDGNFEILKTAAESAKLVAAPEAVKRMIRVQ